MKMNERKGLPVLIKKFFEDSEGIWYNGVITVSYIKDKICCPIHK